MRYKKFKNAEIEVSQLAVGTWAIGGQNYGEVDRNAAIGAILRMLENGVNLIDTAPCYGNGTSEKIVGEVLKVVKQLAKEKRTMVIVTHEIGFAREIADRVIFMSKGEIVEEGRPEEVIENPKKERTKEFLRRYLK